MALWTVEGRTLAVITLAAVLSIAISASAWINGRKLLENQRSVERTYKVLAEVNQLQGDLTTAESAARGFAITGNEVFLPSHARSIEAFHERVERIGVLMVDPGQRARMQQLISLSQERINHLQRVIGLRKESEAAARQRVSSLEGARQMAKVNALLHEIGVEEQRLVRQRSDANRRSTNLTAAIFVTAVGTQFFLLGLIYWMIFTGLRERRRVEEVISAKNDELAKTNREVMHATRMKSRFLASMSHELRTPLTAIIGFSELLSESQKDPLTEKQRRWVKHIRGGATHLLQLINDILDLSKIEAGQMQMEASDFHAHSVAKEVWPMITPQVAAKQIKLIERLDPDLYLYADRTRFKQIMFNLLSNAVKFTPEHGFVIVESFAADDGLAGIAVRDTGIGISPADQRLVFEEFRQAEESAKGIHEGTGLGLAIVKRLVEEQGGRIWLESEVGKGSTFRFSLPHGAAGSSEPEASIPETSGPMKPLILIVEDDGPAREFLLTALPEDQFITATATSGAQAIDMARRLRPSLITMDIMLPGVDGWEVLKQLKSDASTANIPIVVVSIVDRREHGFVLGAADYLVKPVSRDALLTVIHKHLPREGLKTVMAVDDDAATRTLIAEVLTSAGFQVLLADNGVEAWRILQQQVPDAVIADLMMPEMDGFTLLQKMKESETLRQVPVLILTAKELSSHEIERLREQADGVMMKGSAWQLQLQQHVTQVLRDGFEKTAASQ